MQAIALTCVANSHVISNTPGVITREVPNTFTVSLSDSDGAALDTAGITTWELGIARGFLGQTTLLAFTTDITAAGSVLTVTIDTATEEFSAFLAGKLTATVFATLRGYGAGGVSKAAYTFPMTAVNVGYDDTTADTNVLNGLTYTKGVIDAKFAAIGNAIPAATEGARGTIALATAAEATAGTDQSKAITPATLGAALEDAIPVIPPIPADLSDLSDETGILAGKVDKDGDKMLSDNNYTDADAAKVGKIELETLAELTGANVSVAPWTQSKWSASGVCSLTASGWAASGHQIAYIVITLAAEATLSISGTEEVAEDDALIAAGVYECYIKNVDGKKYFRVISFTEAAS